MVRIGDSSGMGQVPQPPDASRGVSGQGVRGSEGVRDEGLEALPPDIQKKVSDFLAWYNALGSDHVYTMDDIMKIEAFGGDLNNYLVSPAGQSLPEATKKALTDAKDLALKIGENCINPLTGNVNSNLVRAYMGEIAGTLNL